MEHGEEAAAFAVAESSRARLLRERLDLPRSRPRSYTIAEYQVAVVIFCNPTVVIQPLKRLPLNQRAVGSSPTAPTKVFNLTA